MRVLVTGLGVVSPVGTGVPKFWKSVLDRASGFAPVRSFDVSAYRTQVGAEVKEAIPRDCRAFALIAAREALGEAKLDLREAGERAAVGLGSTLGEELVLEAAMAEAIREGRTLPEEAMRRAGPGGIAADVARELGARGPVAMLMTACSAGNYALLWAYEKIMSGQADVALAGGVDVFSPVLFSGFNKLLAVAPERCAPFAKDRKGLIPGEGAGMVVLESEESARRRGARAYAQVLGYGVSSDAHHVTMPDAGGVARAITDCLSRSGLAPDDVGYVNAHGTGTPANDRTETAALKSALGPRAARVPVSSIKGVLGHAMGAATALEAVASCLTVREGVLPPTANLAERDSDCDLDYVAEGARKVQPGVVLSNGFAFGGANAVVAFAPAERAARARPGARVVVTAAFSIVDADPVKAAQDRLVGIDVAYADRPISLALLAAHEAQAALTGVAPERRGLILDTAGEAGSHFEFFAPLCKEGPAAVEPRVFPNVLANAAASRAAIAFKLKAVNVALAGSFPGGESAVAVAYDLLRGGMDAVLLAGGVDAQARVYVVETLESAAARGAKPLAEITGLKETFHPEGAREASDCACFEKALRKAAHGFEVAYTARGRWGSRLEMTLSPSENA